MLLDPNRDLYREVRRKPDPVRRGQPREYGIGLNGAVGRKSDAQGQHLGRTPVPVCQEANAATTTLVSTAFTAEFVRWPP